jgi:hypothetical protein
MSIDKIRAYNTKIKAFIDNRDFHNPEVKKYLKIQKVLMVLLFS